MLATFYIATTLLSGHTDPCLFDDVTVVVVTHPVELAVVAREHLELDFEVVADVDVLARLESGSGQRVHVVDGGDRVVRGMLSLKPESTDAAWVLGGS